jgi:5,6-dimethylbenzimidazole synthase
MAMTFAESGLTDQTALSPAGQPAESFVAAPPARRYESAMDFDDEFRARLHDLLVWRRDVRRFRTEPLPPGTLERLIALACLAPSVGLSQPWRFVMVESMERRRAVLDDFAACNAAALALYEGEQAARYAALKLAGLAEAPSQLAVFADRATQTGHGLGRRTMPEMAEYSVVAAITAMWLAARAEGIGMGWVSILDPLHIKAILDVPEAWRFIGYFCLGYPEGEHAEPELERAGWEHRRPADGFVVRR